MYVRVSTTVMQSWQLNLQWAYVSILMLQTFGVLLLALHFRNYSYTINNSKEGREHAMMKKAK